MKYKDCPYSSRTDTSKYLLWTKYRREGWSSEEATKRVEDYRSGIKQFSKSVRRKTKLQTPLDPAVKSALLAAFFAIEPGEDELYSLDLERGKITKGKYSLKRYANSATGKT